MVVVYLVLVFDSSSYGVASSIYKAPLCEKPYSYDLFTRNYILCHTLFQYHISLTSLNHSSPNVF